MGETEATGAGETDPGQMREGSVCPKETVKPDDNVPKAADSGTRHKVIKNEGPVGVAQ